MKTIDEIEKDISDLLNVDRKGTKDSQDNRDRKKIRLFTLCKYYLETNPSEDFVRKMSADERVIIKRIGDGFAAYRENCTESENRDPKKLLLKYNSENELKKHKQQLIALNYLLS